MQLTWQVSIGAGKRQCGRFGDVVQPYDLGTWPSVALPNVEGLQKGHFVVRAPRLSLVLCPASHARSLDALQEGHFVVWPRFTLLLTFGGFVCDIIGCAMLSRESRFRRGMQHHVSSCKEGIL